MLILILKNCSIYVDDLSSGKPTITEPPQNGLCVESGCHIEYTVDGDLSTCAMTEEGTPDTWYVDLLQVENIARIWINYKMPGINTKLLDLKYLYSALMRERERESEQAKKKFSALPRTSNL